MAYARAYKSSLLFAVDFGALVCLDTLAPKKPNASACSAFVSLGAYNLRYSVFWTYCCCARPQH